MRVYLVARDDAALRFGILFSQKTRGHLLFLGGINTVSTPSPLCLLFVFLPRIRPTAPCERRFFGPTVQSLVKMGAAVHLVCLSTGDADGLGETRKKELKKVARFLELSSVTIKDDAR